MPYEVKWTAADGPAKAKYDNLEDAIKLGAKHLDRDVQIVDEPGGTVIRRQAIIDLYEAIEGGNPKR